jgi:glyoxalase family protein
LEAGAVSRLHHVAVIARSIDRAIQFYQGVLGMALVKKTVNPDDPHTPLLIFGDRCGTPGTQIHVLIYPRTSRAVPGVGTVESVALRVPQGSFGFWRSRLRKCRSESGALSFPGLEGLRLLLVEEEAVAGWTHDVRSVVPLVHAVRGLHSVEVKVDSQGQDFWMSRAWPGVRCTIAEQEGSLGYGGVHHLAFFTDDLDQPFDRHYGRSSYFYDPGELLCEVTTEGPGLTVDESEDQLGEQWCVPPWYESRRAEIERVIRSMN